MPTLNVLVVISSPFFPAHDALNFDPEVLDQLAGVIEPVSAPRIAAAAVHMVIDPDLLD